MRVVVASCYEYRDTWTPFIELFNRFYGGEITLLTDRTDYRNWPKWVKVAIEPGNWGQMLAAFASRTQEPILLFLDDFFLNAPANGELIHRGLSLLTPNVGCVRLYPCPGPDEDFTEHFGKVAQNAAYRISTMPAIWQPEFLKQIAERFDNPWDFETKGTEFSWNVQCDVLAFKRELSPWPVSILATGITRAKWNENSKQLFEKYSIPVDWSLRPMNA